MKKAGKRLVAGAVALATAFSLLVGGSFKEPADILQDDTRPAIVEYYVPDAPDDSTDDDDGAVAPEEKKKSLRERFRQLLLRLPFTVRLLVCLPAWFVGWALITLAGAAWSTVLSPVASTVSSVLLTAAVLMGLVVISVKTASPDTPIKKIVNRRNISIVVVCAVAGETCFILLQLFWPEWNRYSDLVRSFTALALILFAALPAVFKGRKKAKA